MGPELHAQIHFDQETIGQWLLGHLTLQRLEVKVRIATTEVVDVQLLRDLQTLPTRALGVIPGGAQRTPGPRAGDRRRLAVLVAVEATRFLRVEGPMEALHVDNPATAQLGKLIAEAVRGGNRYAHRRGVCARFPRALSVLTKRELVKH